MADNTQLNQNTTAGDEIATLDVGGIKHEKVIAEYLVAGVPQMVDATHQLPVSDTVSQAALASIAAEDFATQTTLAAVLAKLSSDPATQTTLAAILAKLISNPATDTLQTTGNTTLASILAKIIAAPATEAKQDTQITALGTLATQATLAAVLAKIIAAPSTEAKQDTIITALATLLTISDFDTKTGALTETAPATDTASSGLNGRLQRIAQRLTSLIALLPAALGAGGGIKVDGSGTALPVSGTVAVTGAGDASAANQTSQITQETAINTVLGLIADATVAAGATGSISAKLRRATQGLEDLKTLIVLAAGTAIIGKVGIDQTTPGTTNLVALSAETSKVIGTVNVSVPTTIFNGKTSVTTAGTRVVLATTQAVKSVTIKALAANTGLIFVGNATVASTNGFQLSPGDSVSMDVADLNTVNIDSAVNGEGVSYIAIS